MKPQKFNLIRNFQNSLNGLIDIYTAETAFRVEVVAFVFFVAVAFLLPIAAIYKAILILSLPIVLIAEIINSAIERAVDTATLEYDENAKKSKDAASTIVLISMLWVGLIWIATLYFAFHS